MFSKLWKMTVYESIRNVSEDVDFWAELIINIKRLRIRNNVMLNINFSM